MANPTPSPPPPVDRICELIPITLPLPSSNGPPELPWLIAASVWIALPIGYLVSDWMSRPSAETTPTDSDCTISRGPLDWPGFALRRSAQIHRKSSLYLSIGLNGEAVSQDANDELSPPPGMSSSGKPEPTSS